MAGAYTQLHIHAVTCVKFRNALVEPEWEKELYHIMGDALIELGHKPIIINGALDHVHLLWDHRRTETLSQTMKIVKGRSSKWLNDSDLINFQFRWQPGYGAFAVSADRVPRVRGYIARQKEHHKVKTVYEEYEGLLISHGIANVAEYQFDPLLIGPVRPAIYH